MGPSSSLLTLEGRYHLHVEHQWIAFSTRGGGIPMVVCVCVMHVFHLAQGCMNLLFSTWSMSLCLLFGFIVSSTDPVAVVALLRELGTPEAVSVLIEVRSKGEESIFFWARWHTFSVVSVDVAPFFSSPGWELVQRWHSHLWLHCFIGSCHRPVQWGLLGHFVAVHHNIRCVGLVPGFGSLSVKVVSALFCQEFSKTPTYFPVGKEKKNVSPETFQGGYVFPLVGHQTFLCRWACMGCSGFFF